MTDHADLTARLRSFGEPMDQYRSTVDAVPHGLLRKAADALDAANAENARLTAERDEALAEVAQLREALAAVVGHKHGNGYSEADAFDLARAALAVSEEATDAEGGPRG